MEMLLDPTLDLHTFYEIDYFTGKRGRFSPKRNVPEIELDKNFDLAIIEGHPSTDRQIDLAKTIRRHAKIVIAVGSCAHIGGVYLNKEKTLPKIIRIDHIIPGCPPDQTELARCLMDLYWGKIFRLPDLAVCFECRQNENDCLIKMNKLCLGPITRGGCNSICINNGEACLGCRGLKPDANIKKMSEILKPILSEPEIEKTMSIFGNLDE
ncbi:MAG TPA: hypothetical protein VJK08_00580 [Patescibacteria group bacterium]|nr:hypothetical protein [Patescibacteria group bacterium]